MLTLEYSEQPALLCRVYQTWMEERMSLREARLPPGLYLVWSMLTKDELPPQGTG